MSSSFIAIKEKGFWAKDGFVEAMQLCLINEIENQKLDSIEWINDYKCKLALQALPLIYGGMSMALEEFVNSEERKTEILQLIEQIIEKIDSEEDYISGTRLHELRIRAMTILSEIGSMEFESQEKFDQLVNDSRWHESEGVAAVKHQYKHAFLLLKKLILGEIHSLASSPEDYWRNC